MLASLLVIMMSLVLLAYWGWHICRLLIASYASEGGLSHLVHLHYAEVRERIGCGGVPAAELGSLGCLLVEDYEMLKGMLEADDDLCDYDRRLLLVAFRLIARAQKLALRLSPGAATKMLKGMTDVVAALAGAASSG